MIAVAHESDFEELHRLGEDEQKAYWGLREATACFQRAVTAAEVSDFLSDHGRLALSRQKISRIFDVAGSKVKRKRLGGRRVYQLMRAGEEAIAPTTPNAILLDPATGLQSIRKFEEILESLSGVVRICDPYLERRSLDFLVGIGKAQEIRFLTHTILDESRFRRDLAAAGKQATVPLEIRVTATPHNHDRYFLSDNYSFLLGTSLNGVAKKQAFLMPLAGLAVATLASFDRDWAAATKFK